MRGVLRSAKNFTRGYSDVQVLVRDATSNDAGGPTTLQLEQIAGASHGGGAALADIAYILDKRLNDSGRNWRHVYKTLVVAEYCVVCGGDGFVAWASERLHAIRTLRQFVAVDDRGRDRGEGVRARSKALYALLTDPERLAEARRTRSLPLPADGDVCRLGSPPPRPPSRGRAHSDATRTHAIGQSHGRRRASFDDLQTCGEDEALRRALALSAAESRPESQTASLLDLDAPEEAGAGRQAAPQALRQASSLLDLDDDAFSRALEVRPARTDSLLGLSLAGPAVRQDVFSDAFAVAPADPFGNAIAPPVQPLQIAAAPAQPSGVHAIAIPAKPAAEQTIGAKPVMPGSVAPRFGNATAMAGSAAASGTGDDQRKAQPADDLLGGQVVPAQQSSSRQGERDPFADLF